MTPGLWLAIGIAGGLGAAARYVVDFAITRRTGGLLPWGTWAVNISGSAALGAMVGLTLARGVPPEVQLVIGGGFLGAYTTFSTWMYESVRLVEEGAWPAALLNLVGSVIPGAAAAGAAWALMLTFG